MADAKSAALLDGGAVSEVARLAYENRVARVINLPEPQGLYLVQRPDGFCETRMPDRKFRRLGFPRPENLLRFVQEYLSHDPTALKEAAVKEALPACFVGPAEVRCVWSVDRPEDCAVCAMPHSEQMQWLLKHSGEDMTQDQIVRALRVTFSGCVQGDVLQILRKVRWTATAEGKREITQGADSMGRAVNAEVKASNAIPETINLVVPVFDNYEFKRLIHCDLEAKPDGPTFAITVLPQEQDLAMDAALRDIASMFEKELPTFIGAI